MINIILFAIYVLFSAGALLLFKHYGLSAQSEMGSVFLRFHIMTVFAVFSYVASFVIWLVIVSRMKLSVAMPLNFGLVNLAVLIGAAFFLRERITAIQWAGAAVILIGIFMITQGEKA